MTKCLKSRLLLAQTREVSVRNEQYIEIPRAIADENGLPHKGQKSHAVHIVFDNAGRMNLHPKTLERERRDAHVETMHDHLIFTDEMRIPKKWSEILECRKCKRRLVVYLGDCILRIVPQLLSGEQKVYIGGAGDKT